VAKRGDNNVRCQFSLVMMVKGKRRRSRTAQPTYSKILLLVEEKAGNTGYSLYLYCNLFLTSWVICSVHRLISILKVAHNHLEALLKFYSQLQHL